LENFAGDFLQPVKAFALTGADCFGIQIKRPTNLIVAEIGKVTKLDNFTACLTQSLDCFVHQPDLFARQKSFVGAGRRTWRVQRQTAFGVFRLQRKRRLSTSTLGGVLAFTKILRFIGCNPENPGLKLTLTVKRIQVPDNRKENFLTNLFNVLGLEITSELEYKSTGCLVVLIKKLIPCSGISATAPLKQFTFNILTHANTDLI